MGVLTVIVVIALVVILVVQPNQRAKQAAVDAFGQAAAACQNANAAFSAAVSATQALTSGDAGVATIINTAVSSAQQTPACQPPNMAGVTSAIHQQADDLSTATHAVSAATDTLTSLTAAVQGFQQASGQCTNANQALVIALASAQSKAQTNPSTVQDASVLDQLNQAISDAQAVPACTPPAIDADTVLITQQTTTMTAATNAVTQAASSLSAASSAVDASVAAKQAAAAAAMSTGSGDFHDAAGYTFKITWTAPTIKVTTDSAQGQPGTTRITMSTDGIKYTLTNTTPGKAAPSNITGIMIGLVVPVSPAVGVNGRGNGRIEGIALDRSAGCGNQYTMIYVWQAITWKELAVGGSTSGTLGLDANYVAPASLTWDVPDSEVQAVASQFSQPVGWIAWGPSTWGNDLRPTGQQKSFCFTASGSFIVGESGNLQ